MTDLATERAITPAAVPADDPAPASRLQRVLASDWAKTFGMVAAFHLVLTAIAVLFQNALPSYQPGNPTQILGNDLTLLSHTFRWDSAHFWGVLNGQYTDPAAPPWKTAFYPLFPASVGLVQLITFGKLGFLAAGFLVNFVASWLAATALLKITRHFVTSTWAPWLAVTAFLTAPTAYFLHAFYSEAIFCALGFWAYRFALSRQWAWMGLCLIPITATRITSVLFIGLCLLEFFRAKEWKLRGLLSWHLLWFPAGFLGFAAYALYLKVVKGDALSMFHAYDYGAWPYHVSNPNFPLTIAKELKTSVSAVVNSPGAGWEPMVNHLIPMTALAVLLIASGYLVYVHRGAGIPLAAFGVVSIVMFTLNSNLVSVHRYVLPCLVVYVAMATAADRSTKLKPVMYGLMFTHAMVMTFLYSLFLSGVWSG